VPHNLAIGWLPDDFAAVVEGEKDMPPELATGHDGLTAQMMANDASKQARAHRYLGQETQDTEESAPGDADKPRR